MVVTYRSVYRIQYIRFFRKKNVIHARFYFSFLSCFHLVNFFSLISVCFWHKISKKSLDNWKYRTNAGCLSWKWICVFQDGGRWDTELTHKIQTVSAVRTRMWFQANRFEKNYKFSLIETHNKIELSWKSHKLFCLAVTIWLQPIVGPPCDCIL